MKTSIDKDYIFKVSRFAADFGTGIDDNTFNFLCAEASELNGQPWFGNYISNCHGNFKLTWKQRLLGTIKHWERNSQKTAVFEFGDESTRDLFVRTIISKLDK